VGKDIELQNMRETEEKLRLEIIQKKEDIERFDSLLDVISINTRHFPF
jgi:hypothetical protein